MNHQLSPIHHQLNGWLCLWLARRRRKRASHQTETPNAPVITSGIFETSPDDPAWFDTVIEFTFDPGSFSNGLLEMWFMELGGDYFMLESFNIDVRSYRHSRVSQVESTLFYKVRFVNDDFTGPFSNEIQIDISI